MVRAPKMPWLMTQLRARGTSRGGVRGGASQVGVQGPCAVSGQAFQEAGQAGQQIRQAGSLTMCPCDHCQVLVQHMQQSGRQAGQVHGDKQRVI